MSRLDTFRKGSEMKIGDEDLFSLKSRVSWSAVLAGSTVAFAVYILLTLFFTGIGASLTEAGVRSGVIGWGAVAAAVMSIVIALFAGGCTTTKLTAGENFGEAVIHGLLTWATVTVFSVMIMGVGVRAGYGALVEANSSASQNQATEQPGHNWEEMARAAGVPQPKIEEMKKALPLDSNNKQNSQSNASVATFAAWMTLLGTVLSMLAAILGALAGIGPQYRVLSRSMRTERTLITP